MKQVYKLIIVLSVLYSSNALKAQNFQALDVNKSTDANPNNGGFSSYYDQACSKFEYAVLNGVAYFAADDGIHGIEIWKSDGTASGTVMVKDINPGNASSNIHDITVSGNKIYFCADDGVHGLELWITDGTRANTKMLKDIYEGAIGSSPAYLIDGDGELYFFANNASTGDELWKTDGTKNGTEKIASFYTPDFNYSQYGNQLTYVNGHLFFAMNGGSGFYFFGDQELWTSDGTLTGTFLVKQINPYFGYGFLYSLTALNGLLYFSAADGSGRQLWVSDGTYFGTNPVSNVNGIYLREDAFNNEYNKFLIKDNKLYFPGYSAANSDGSELCVYDPYGLANPEVIKDFNPGYYSNNLYNLTNVNNDIFFTVYNGSDQTLWKSDGTTNGTVQVKDINPKGRNIYYYKNFHNANGTLLFSFYNDANGIELWKSDGTDEGTVMVKDIQPGIYSSYQGNGANITYIGNNISLFAASNGKTGFELWRTDNTESGTKLVKDINQSSTASSNPQQFALSYDSSKLFFAATNQKFGTEMHVTDGTQAGTEMLKDVYAGTINPYNLQPFFPASTSDATYFFAGLKDKFRKGTSDPFELNRFFKTTGTSEGTVHVIAPDFYNLIDANASLESVATAGNLYYIVLYNFTTNYQELWRTDGTTAGTFAVKTDIDPYYNLNATGAGNILFFVNDDGFTGPELWKTDGTSAGTALVKDIDPGDLGSFPANLYNFNGKIYFIADYGYGPFLWTSDGTNAGTKVIKNSFVGFTPFAQANGKLFFNAENTISQGYELFASDGTAAGTHIVRDINPGAFSSSPIRLISGDTLLYFIANDGKHGNELWRSNGTWRGTNLVKDITPGIDPTNFNDMVNVHDKLFFIMNNTLWQSDGTEDDTYQVNDPSLAGITNIFSLTAAKNRLYFSGYKGSVGQELFTAEIPASFDKPNITATDISSSKIAAAFETRLLSNPFTDQLKFTVNTKAQQNAQVMITDVLGRIIIAEKKTLTAGTNMFSYTTKSWTYGMYLIRVVTADGSSAVLKAAK